MDHSEIYEFIGNELAAIIPEDAEWDEANLSIKLTRGNMGYQGSCIKGSQAPMHLDVGQISDEMYDYIAALFYGMNENRTNLWNRAIFKLHPDGKFHMHFDWDEELARESGEPDL